MSRGGTRLTHDEAEYSGGVMERHHADKSKSAKSFRKDASKTNSLNVRQKPLRGGWRL